MKPRRILIIDDCKLSLALARDMLVRAGHEVFLAESGIEANRYIFGIPRPDLIIMDVEMPLLRGDRKVRMLKDSPTTRDISVVLVSHKDAAVLAELCQNSGADSFLTKPLREHELLDMVRYLS
jgi:CheY-like chemotaxis protein